MTARSEDFPLGQKLTLPGHFAVPVVLEAVRKLGEGYEYRVRLQDGSPDEAILSSAEAELLFGKQLEAPAFVRPVDPERLRRAVESARIRLAYAHDRHFAVSLSGIRTLPHQIEAVYIRMLPQPRLRFLLADDPGAGKTIMAGLLHKEIKLREGIERVLILCPAPLTIQWQDELLRWFGEPFDIIVSAVDQHQLVNPWHRSTQVIASLDYAKQDDVREWVWNERWDLVTQLGDSYWLYVVWDPLGDRPELLVIRNPAAKLDPVKKEVVAARYFDIPADAIKQHGRSVA